MFAHAVARPSPLEHFKVKAGSLLKEGLIRASEALRGQLRTLGHPVGPLRGNRELRGETGYQPLSGFMPIWQIQVLLN